MSLLEFETWGLKPLGHQGRLNRIIFEKKDENTVKLSHTVNAQCTRMMTSLTSIMSKLVLPTNVNN